jgi:hypothetical protein
MLSKLLNSEKANTTLVIALSGTIMALVANGPGPVSLGRMVSGALSNPVPGGAAGTRRSSYVPAPRQQQVAA